MRKPVNMTKVLMALLDGEPKVSTEVRQATGMEKKQIESTICHLIAKGLIQSTPVLYTITPAGMDALVAYQHADEAPAVVKKLKPLLPAPIVERAIASRHALDVAWRAGA